LKGKSVTKPATPPPPIEPQKPPSKKYKCKICEDEFETEDRLRRHIAKQHPENF
jgi:hypothetical protein